MRSPVAALIRFLVSGMLTAAALFLVGCSLIAGSGGATPIVSPHEGGPVTVTVKGRMLVIANNTPNTIYHLAFPTEILAAMEWAPCLAPEVCPADQRIDPGDEKRIALRTITREGTESITVFWWHYLEKLPGATVPPMELEEISVVLP